jgi:hypothetical protein
MFLFFHLARHFFFNSYQSYTCYAGVFMYEHAHSSACLEDLKRLRVPLKPNALHGLKDKIMDLIVVFTFYSQRTGLNLVEGNYILHIHVSYNLQLVL